mgnify:CR=1 FL=1
MLLHIITISFAVLNVALAVGLVYVTTKMLIDGDSMNWPQWMTFAGLIVLLLGNAVLLLI